MANLSTNLLSGIIAIIFALTSVIGGMGAADKPVSADISLEASGDFAAAEGSTIPVDAVLKLFNGLSLHYAAQKDAAQVQFLLGGKPVASLAVKAQDEGWAAVSNLFPSTKLVVSNEYLQANNPFAQLSQQLTNAFGGTDIQALITAVSAPLTELFAKVNAAVGEPETGTFTVNGKEFTTKVPFNLTTKEAVTMVLTAVDSILSSEAAAPLKNLLGDRFNPETVKNALKNIADTPDENLPVLSAAMYTNAAEDKCVDVSLVKDAQSITFNALSAGQVTTVTLKALDQLNVQLVADNQKQTLDVDASLVNAASGMNLALTVKGENLADTPKVSAHFDVKAAAQSFSFGVNVAIGHEAPVFEAGADLKELKVAEMTETDSSLFNTEVLSGMMTVLANLAQENPELVNMFVPTSGPAVETPEDAPAVETEEAPEAEEAPAA